MGSLALQGAGSVGLPGLSSTAGTGGSFYDWGAGLTLCQPLLDGGAASSAIDGAQQQTRLSEIALGQARQAIVLSVQTWWAWYQGAQTQIEASRAAVRAAEQARLLDAQLRYWASIAPILEVLIAQRDLQAARSGLAWAIQRWNLSRAVLVADSGERAGGMAGALLVGRRAAADSWGRQLGQTAPAPWATLQQAPEPGSRCRFTHEPRASRARPGPCRCPGQGFSSLASNGSPRSPGPVPGAGAGDQCRQLQPQGGLDDP